MDNRNRDTNNYNVITANLMLFHVLRARTWTSKLAEEYSGTICTLLVISPEFKSILSSTLQDNDEILNYK